MANENVLKVVTPQTSEFLPHAENVTWDEHIMVVGMQKIVEQYPHSFFVGRDQENMPFLISRGDENGLSINHVLIDRTGIFQVVAHGLSESLHQKIGRPGAIEAFRQQVQEKVDTLGNMDAIQNQVFSTTNGSETGIDSFIYNGRSADPVAKVDDLRYTLAAHDHLLLEDIQIENMAQVQAKLDKLSAKFEHPLYKARHQLIFGDYSHEANRTLLESKDGMFSEEVTLDDGSSFMRDVIPTENGLMVIMNYVPTTGESSNSFSITAELDNDSLTIRSVMPGDICEHIYEPKMSKVPLAVLGTKFIDEVKKKGPYAVTLDIVSAEVITEDDVKWGTAPARTTEFSAVSEKSHDRIVIKDNNGQIETIED